MNRSKLFLTKNIYQRYSISTLSSILLLIVINTTVLAQDDQNTVSRSIPTVTVVAAKIDPVVARIPVSGTLVGREIVQVNPKINGYEIETIKADIGDQVTKGDTLLQLDNETLKAQLAQADADIVRAKATVRQSQSQIDSAKATMVQATTTLKRNQKLRDSGAISISVLDESKAAADAARASFASSEDGLIVAHAQLTQLNVQRDVAALNLSRATVKAPVSGLVSSRNARLGAIASTGSAPLFEIIEEGDIEMEAEVIETALSGVKTGNKVVMDIAGVGQKTGTVRLVSPTVDRDTRLGLIRITLDSDPAIKIGLFAKGWIILAKRNAIVVPTSAVISSIDGSHVMVANAGVIEKRSVAPGVIYQNSREIVSGLSENEMVLMRPGNFYREGDRVNPVLKSSEQVE